MKRLVVSFLFLVFAGYTFSQNHFDSQQIITQAEIARPASIDFADFDGDSDPDVAVLSSMDGKLVWYENTDGLGSFGPQIVITDTLYAGNELKAAEVDNDGDMDIIVSNSQNMYWFENKNSSGTFGIPKVITSASFNNKFITTDIDGDNNLDLILADGPLQWLEYSSSTGTFEFFAPVNQNINNAYFLTMADFDNDGDLDFITSSVSLGMNGYLLYCEHKDLSTYPFYQSPFKTEVTVDQTLNYYADGQAADLDSDGDQDIVVSNPNSHELVWYENTNGQGTFSSKKIISDSMPGVNKIFPADIDGDGDVDIAANQMGKGNLFWYENVDGNGNFVFGQMIDTTSLGARDLLMTDFNSDSTRDILSNAMWRTRISWFKNDSSGIFSLQQHLANADFSGGRSIFPADLNNDQLNDILVASELDNRIGWYENISRSSSFHNYQLITDTAYGAQGVTAADIDSDGDYDVIIAAEDKDQIAWFENLNGNGNFGPMQVITTNVKEAHEVSPVDLDNDGDQDLVVASDHQFLG